MSQITFGSVCSGIEAASVAWNPLGWEAVWLSEIEKYPSKLLAHRYPNVPNLGDMRQIPRLLRSGLIVPPDVFTGGTPCQAFSLAGLRNSLDDARGNLSLTFCEIANEIDIQRAANGLLPSTIVWENVPGVLSTKDNAFGYFLAGLAGEDDPLIPPGKKWSDAGCVYGPQRTVAWRVLDAQYFGLAQRRRRVFVVASARDGFDPTAVLFEFDGVRRDTAPRRQTPQDVAAGTLRSTDGGCDLDHARAGHLRPVAYGGNNRGGPIDVATACRAHSGPHLDFESETFLVQPVTGTLDASYARLQGCSGQDATHGHSLLVPIGFDSRQDPVSSTEVFGALGSSSPQAQAVAMPIQNATRGKSQNGLGIGQPGDPMYTLDQASQHAVACVTTGAMCAHTYTGGMGGRVDAAVQGYVQPIGMAVRRLTPRECERLQGFPDDYTAIPFGRVIRAEKMDSDFAKYLMRGGVMTFEECLRAAADGPRYKALGNSWAVPKVRWLGARIDRELSRLTLLAA